MPIDKLGTETPSKVALEQEASGSELSKIAELARAMRFGRKSQERLGRTVFMIGAGCSISAGIPGAADIAKIMMVETAKRMELGPADSPEIAYEMLRNQGLVANLASGDSDPDWYRAYDRLFEDYYRTQDDTRELFEDVVSRAGNAINWAHLCLGELVARNYVSTILTTNFDQLVLKGLVRAGVIPVVSDGLESLNRISGSPLHPQLIELHGSRHTYTLRNHPLDVRTIQSDQRAVAAIGQLLQYATTFVVVGYGGREAGIMDLLVRASENFPDKNLYWVAHAPSVDQISSGAREFLKHSKHSVCIVGADADEFFFQLSKELGIGVPNSIRDPLHLASQWVDEAMRSSAENNDILAELDSARARIDALRSARRQPSPTEEVRALRLSGEEQLAYESALSFVRAAGGISVASADLVAGLADSALEYAKASENLDPYLVAIESMERLLKEDAAPDRADTLSRLGGALLEVGLRQHDEGYLARAETAHSEALAAYEREGNVEGQLGSLNNIGIVLCELADLKQDRSTFDRAIEAYRRGLGMVDDSDLQSWMMLQTNLAMGLSRIGTTWGGDAGSGYLAEAEDVLRNILERFPADGSPKRRATVYLNLANVTSIRDRDRPTNESQLRAIEYYERALALIERSEEPQRWAMVQYNLGLAHLTRGILAKDDSELRLAISAFSLSLEERVPQQNRHGYTLSVLSLARSKIVLGGRTNDENLLLEGKEALLALLSRFGSKIDEELIAEIREDIEMATSSLANRSSPSAD